MEYCKTICGADCTQCPMHEECRGCAATNGCPFGGPCVAASYIRIGGREAYQQFKTQLTEEVNALLRSLDIPETPELHELPGIYINLEYPFPNGKTFRLLDDKRVYLGCQIEFADLGVCYGVAADTGFILISSYSVNGSAPEVVLYKRR